MKTSNPYRNVGPAASLALLVLSSTAHATAGGGAPVLTRIVERGDQASGLGQGLVIAGFGPHPDLAQVFGIGDVPARIDRQGNVVFHAFATEDGLPGVCPLVDLSLCPPEGLFRVLDGQLELIVAKGDDAPGASLPFAGFPAILPVTPRIADGRVVVLGEIGENIFADGQVGVWSDQSGTLELLVLEENTVLPGMPSDGELTRPFFFEVNDDKVFFSSEFDTGQLPTDFHPQGLWRFGDGGVEPIGVAGTPAPGFPAGVVFGDSDNINILGTFGSFDSNDAGRVAFTAFVRGPGIRVRADEAVWVETDSGFDILLREDAPVTDGPFAPGSTFSNGDILEGAFLNEVSPPIRMNNPGEVVFFAQVDVPGDPPRVPTLWSNRNGSLELVFRGRQRGVAFSVPGDAAPGIPGGNFFFPNNTDINDDGHIAVRAFVETNNNLFDSTIGIWVDRGDGFEAVAFEEGPVPGVPGATFIPETQNVRGVGDFVLERDGTVIYTGIFLDQSLFTLGLFRHPPEGEAELVLRTGGEVDINGAGDDIRVVANFRTGVGSSDDAAKVVGVAFTDGSAGLYAVGVGPDRLGDLDGDGVVGIADFLMLLGDWGPCASCAECASDLDGDCTVDITDLLTLLGNWD